MVTNCTQEWHGALRFQTINVAFLKINLKIRYKELFLFFAFYYILQVYYRGEIMNVSQHLRTIEETTFWKRKFLKDSNEMHFLAHVQRPHLWLEISMFHSIAKYAH